MLSLYSLSNIINTSIFSPFPQDLYVYVSQEEVFSDFNNTESLFWFHRDLVYGDWTTGENGDGCYEHYKEMEIPEVGMMCNVRLTARKET